MKQQPLGICDHCLGPIPPGQWYTSKRKPRRYCSIECKNTANSRSGAPIRAEKMRERIRRGEWVNPVEIAGPPPPEEQARRARIGRLREVREGRWRNPGLTPEARAINSRPHKHTGALASAIEKLTAGARVSELTPEEQEAYRAYRRELWNNLPEVEKARRRAARRARYHARKKSK